MQVLIEKSGAKLSVTRALSGDLVNRALEQHIHFVNMTKWFVISMCKWLHVYYVNTCGKGKLLAIHSIDLIIVHV